MKFVLLSLVFASLLLLGCTSSNEGSSTNTIVASQPPSTTTVATQKATTAPTIQANGLSIKVTNVTYGQTARWPNCGSQGPFENSVQIATVTFTVQNNNQESKDIYYSDFKLEEADGTQYDYYPNPICDSMLETLQPKFTETLVAVFKVPAGVKATKIIIDDQPVALPS